MLKSLRQKEWGCDGKMKQPNESKEARKRKNDRSGGGGSEN